MNDISSEDTVCNVNQCKLFENCDDSLELQESNTDHLAWFSTSSLATVQNGQVDFINYYTDVDQEQELTVCLKCYRDDNELLFESNNF